MSGEGMEARGHEGTPEAVTHFVMLDTNIMDAAHTENSRYCIRGAVFMPSQTEHLPGWAIATGRNVAYREATNDDVVANPMLPPVAGFKYRTLDISAMSTRTRSRADNTSDSGRRQALSLRRGHFKDYRSSNGLFGNPALKGVYYFGPTTTGSLEAGEVVKDYTTGGANG